ncbi:hypothetical protein BC833DRAFT_621220 [Globomyces pollinis-pini]|nr:hypothetical protein BC833DRAFT_621220 [Globomyces pollinis-pini]
MLKKIERTSTICWSPATLQDPLLALGTVAGALDASFSSKTELEIFGLGLQSNAKRMNKIAGIPGILFPGLICRFNRISWGTDFLACGKENGEMDIWNPTKVLAGKEDALVLRTTNHSGPVKGLHFNQTQTHLLASGATDGEILIWDMNQMDTPYAPGARSQRLEDVTFLAWNKDVPQILASGSSNGYTVVWDLRNRKELIKIPYPGGRKPVTSIAWNPAKPTQMVTCSDDDANPVILMWDLRNASAAERSFAGHSKGILSMDWCPKDPELLLSCGKDNRTIVWNTNLGEPIGDLAHSDNWGFDTKWCPRNPDLCVVASFDGLVAVHSIQGASNHPEEDVFSPVPAQEQVQQLDPNDPFASIGHQDIKEPSAQPIFSLPHPPKWLRRPVGAVWGFGGKLVCFDEGHTTSVTVKTFPLNEELAFRTDQLDFILKQENPDTSAQYCDYMAHSEFVLNEKDKDVWKFLKTLFSANSRDDMLDFLGVDGKFSSDEKLNALLKKLKITPPVAASPQNSPKTAENADVADKPVTDTPSLGPFSVYSNRGTEESDIDGLITKALIIGDFEMAVSVCIGANRMADALVLAVNGGNELLEKTQKEFFKRYSKTKPYVRILQSITEGDLTDIVNQARVDANEGWKDLLALICTYSKPEDLAGYFATLGDRLMKINTTLPKDQASKGHAAALCFIGAGEFELVSNIWFPQEDTKTLPDSKKSIEILSLIEKIALFKQAVRFQDQRISLEEFEDKFPLSGLYDKYINFAYLATHNGKVEMAWRFLEQVPVNYIPEKNMICDIHVLRDRVYKCINQKLGVTGGDPAFPYESVDVIDGEAIRIANENAERQRLQQQQQSTRQQYGQSQPQYNPGQTRGSISEPFNPINRNPPYQQPWQQTQPSNTNWNNNQQHPPPTQTNSWQPAPPPVNNSWQPNPPPAANSWQPTPPPASNNWQPTPPPVANAWQPTPPPPTSNSWQNQQPNSANSWQQPPPINPNTWVPPSNPQAPWNGQATAPSVPPPSGSTGHAPPIPAQHFQPPTYVAPNSQYDSSHQHTAPQNEGISKSAPLGPPPVTGPPKPDRSKITKPGDKACFESLQKLMVKFSSLSKTPQEKRNLEEAEKKINILYDQMNEGKVDSTIIAELQSILNALNKSDFSTASKIHVDLISKKFDATGQWIGGVKKLIDALERFEKPPAPSPSVTSPHQPFGSGMAPPPISGNAMPNNLPPPPINRPPPPTFAPPPISGPPRGPSGSATPSQPANFAPPPITGPPRNTNPSNPNAFPPPPLAGPPRAAAPPHQLGNGPPPVNRPGPPNSFAPPPSKPVGGMAPPTNGYSNAPPNIAPPPRNNYNSGPPPTNGYNSGPPPTGNFPNQNFPPQNRPPPNGSFTQPPPPINNGYNAPPPPTNRPYGY